MTGPASPTQDTFRRILTRNISLPLAVGALSAVLFVVLVFYLLSALKWVEHTERSIGNANQVFKLSADMETGMRGFLITGDEAFLQPYELARGRIAGEITAVLSLVSDNLPQVDRMRRVGALQNQWLEFAQEMIQAKRNKQDYQEAVRASRGKGVTDEIRRELTSFIAVEQRLLQERNEEARSTTLWSVVAYLVFTLLMSSLLAIFGRRELLRLSDTFETTLRQQADDAQVLSRLAWVRTGQTKLAERMIDEQALAPMGRHALEFLASYLDAPVGALYVRHDSGDLKRIASYGFSRSQGEVAKDFYQADGLVGQAAQSNHVLQLDDLPDDYLKVVSGLGEGKLRHVLIVPVHNDGRVNGVMEFGFLRALEARDLELVKVVASSVGTAIYAALARQRLQDALAETQQLNEELQVQQEELRTANEELEEQSRVLKESQATLENQQAELEQTNVQLGEQALALDQKNAALHLAQSQLEQRADELTRASRYKSEFLANMSHELRTPLNSSLILAKLLAENKPGNLSSEQVKFAESIHNAGNDLLNLINDILDIAKVEAGTLEVRPEVTPLSSIAGGLQAMFEPLASRKGVQLQIAIHDGAPRSVHTDRH
ncbi:MAG: response regulator, partial [Polaromonas sp.]|nr:response regulator [Polaromonas sp.]